MILVNDCSIRNKGVAALDYQQLSKEQLIVRIEELQMLNEQLKQEIEQQSGLDFPWTGNLGHWYWHIKTNHVTFNPRKVTNLGYAIEEIPETVTYQFFTEKLHPEDYESTMQAMRDHLQSTAKAYEAEYRIRTKDGNYRWYFDIGCVTKTDEQGHATFLAGIVFDITERKVAQLELDRRNRELTRLSVIDGLTQLYNHSAMMDRIQECVLLIEQGAAPCSLIMLDIDHFKQVNDTFGHLYGDRILRDIAEILRRCCRKTDFAGRYGGEEFILLLPGTPLQEAYTVAERIRLSIEQQCNTDQCRVTVSGGVAQYTTGNAVDLINAADVFLYKAKKQGRNRICWQ